MLDRLRISPWTAVALAALVAAFSGNALAGGEATQSAKPFTAKKAKRLFNKLIKQRAGRLSVANARHADKADAATTATTATTATSAASATNATNADKVGGLQVKELVFAAFANTPETVLFSDGGLSIAATCPANPLDGPEITASATGTAEGALKFAGQGFNPGNPIVVDTYQFNSSDAVLDLDAGEDRGIGQLSFLREDGVTVNGGISWDDGMRTGDDLCGVSGTLIVG